MPNGELACSFEMYLLYNAYWTQIQIFTNSPRDTNVLAKSVCVLPLITHMQNNWFLINKHENCDILNRLYTKQDSTHKLKYPSRFEETTEPVTEQCKVKLSDPRTDCRTSDLSGKRSKAGSRQRECYHELNMDR